MFVLVSHLISKLFSILSAYTSGARKHKQPRPVDDAEVSDQCPEPNGFFADAEQCDKYYECSNGKITDKLCPDGMVFNDFSSEYEKCDLPFNIDCLARPQLRK